ncbi:hypothetical protein JTB14_002593, partial [Gonioctena quinquepunctata]
AAPSDPLTQLYSITYMYYAFIGCFITILMGWTISYFTSSEDDRYDEELVHPIAIKMANYFPGKKRIYSKKVDSLGEKSEKNGCCTKSLGEKLENGFASSSSLDGKKGSLNPTFSPDQSDEPVDGIYKTKL